MRFFFHILAFKYLKITLDQLWFSFGKKVPSLVQVLHGDRRSLLGWERGVSGTVISLCHRINPGKQLGKCVFFQQKCKNIKNNRRIKKIIGSRPVGAELGDRSLWGQVSGYRVEDSFLGRTGSKFCQIGSSGVLGSFLWCQNRTKRLITLVSQANQSNKLPQGNIPLKCEPQHTNVPQKQPPGIFFWQINVYPSSSMDTGGVEHLVKQKIP